MNKKKRKLWIEGMVFGLSLLFFVWLVYFSVVLYLEGWNIGISGCLCIGMLAYLAVFLCVFYGHALWRAFQKYLDERLRETYLKKYMPHAEDKLYLEKEYNDVKALQKLLPSFWIERMVVTRKEILLQLLEQNEKDNRTDGTMGQADAS